MHALQNYQHREPLPIMTITRRSLFLGSAAVILTPGLLMPVRKIIVPEYVMEFGRIENFRFIETSMDRREAQRLYNKWMRAMLDNKVIANTSFIFQPGARERLGLA